jgi:hypothetical protein
MARDEESFGAMQFVKGMSPTPMDTGADLATRIRFIGDEEQDEELVEGLSAALELAEPEPKYVGGAQHESRPPVKVAALRPQTAETARAKIPASGVTAYDFGVRTTEAEEKVRAAVCDEAIREVPLRVTGMVGAFQRPSTFMPAPCSSYGMASLSRAQPKVPMYIGQRPRTTSKKTRPAINIKPEDPKNLVLCASGKHLLKK